VKSAPTALCALVLSGAVLVLAACGGAGDDGASNVGTDTPTASAPTAVPGAAERATLRGTLTLDGASLNAQFLGVRVIRDGLVAACQNNIPAVIQGYYEVRVAADAEVSGCGAPGAELLLWAFTNDQYFFSEQTVPWPGGGGMVTFDASFSSSAPEGAGKPVTEFKGHLFARDGSMLPGGTVIEAFAGDVRCGVTSLRYGDVTEGYYTLIVAGPESVAGCAQDATLTFRLDGVPAVQTAVNDLARDSEDRPDLDLTVQ
jgi:hypothetical protein